MSDITAFSNGVEEGGLRDSLRIKLLIEYLIDKIKEPITSEIIIKSISDGGIANYFDVTQAVEELKSNGSILANDEGFLLVTPKGDVALRELMNELPASVKEVAMDKAEQELKISRNEADNLVEVLSGDDGYNVICKVMHGDAVLMQLDIYAADIEEATVIKNNFINDPAKVYRTVLDMLEN